jgi:KRAB domain-containing zinc finger protein
LTDHVKLHYKKHYGCEVCGEIFKQARRLFKHTAKVHGTEEPKSVTKTGQPKKPKPETVESTPPQSTVSNTRELHPLTDDVDVESLHKCEICDETFPTTDRLNNHIAWHSRRKRYKCTICNRIFKYLSIFRKHQALHAKRRKNYQQPQLIEPDKTAETSEAASKTEPLCEECNKSFSCQSSLCRHMREYHRGRQRTKVVTNLNVLKRKYTCQVCFKTFASIPSLRVHRERTHPLKTHHKCNFCGKGFPFPSRLKEHMVIHQQRKHPDSTCPYQCYVCLKVFRYPSRLKEHLRRHKKKEQPVAVSMVRPAEQHPCSVWGNSFPDQSQLREYETTHFKQETVTMDSEEQHSCNTCGETFSKESHETGHQEKSSHPHKCSVCGKGFPYVSYLKRHETAYHKQKLLGRNTFSEESLECKICNRTFQHLFQLEEHSNAHNTESETESLKCKPHPIRPSRKRQKVDHSTSTSDSEMPYHEPQEEDISTTSIPERQYECDICGNTFLYESFLYRHYGVHERDSTNKSYLCVYCDRLFQQSNHLKKHCLTQHNTDRIFRCDGCLVIFAKKLQLRDHQQTCPKRNENGTNTESQHVDQRRNLSKVSAVAQHSNNGASQSTGKSADGSKRVAKTSKKAGLRRAAIGRPKKSNKKRITPTCYVCGSTFSSNGALKLHLDIHLDRRPYSCRFCDQKFRQCGHLSVHCRAIHNEECPYLCNLCGDTFTGAALLKTHQEVAHPLTEDPNELDGFEGSVTAAYSGVDFEPNQHTRVINSTEYYCELCGPSARTFKSLSGLRRHTTIVHTNSSFQEARSPRGMVTVTRQDSPVNAVPSEEIYKCNICSVIVHGSEALAAHEKAHAKRNVDSPGSTPPMLSNLSPSALGIKQLFECKYCGEEFDSMSREAFDQHQLGHELAAEEPMGMAYMCVECDKEFALPGDLIKHHEEAH